MACVENLSVYFALFLAITAAWVSVPRTGPDAGQRLIALLSTQALAIDMPLAPSDDDQLFVSP